VGGDRIIGSAASKHSD